ncbi:outer membrane protein [Camelimonas abortus]|uniref:Outer membrane protein n=1 Tax=Camelimonas abortus TaxID=1017184 RepID=A0ABV7LEW8_9HYPH
MKHFLFSVATFGLAVNAALAADLPSRKEAPVAPAPVAPLFSWTGFYAGVHGGYATRPPQIEAFSLTPDGSRTPVPLDSALDTWRREGKGGLVGGAQAGYNYQIGALVLGVEGDLTYAGLQSRADGGQQWWMSERQRLVGFLPWPTVHTRRFQEREASARSTLDWYGTARARIGFTPAERLLVYGTGGFAFGKVTTSASYVSATDGSSVERIGGASASGYSTGWVVGAGAEYALTDSLSVKAEYNYLVLSPAVRTIRSDGNDGRLAVRSRPAFQVFRAGLNYRF